MDFLISSAYAQAAGAAEPPGLLPNLLLFGGLLADAMDRRRLMMLTQGSQSCISATLLILAIVGGLSGRITDLGETFANLEIAPGVTVKVQKSAISMVLPKGTLKSA